MKIVFIAGPYFGDGNYEEIEKNIRCAEQYQVQLANHGIGFFCPHNHTEHFEKKVTILEGEYGRWFSEQEVLFESKLVEDDRVVLKEFYEFLRPKK